MESASLGLSSVASPTWAVVHTAQADPFTELLDGAVAIPSSQSDTKTGTASSPAVRHPSDPGVSPLLAQLFLQAESPMTAAESYRAVRESYPGTGQRASESTLNLVG